MYNLLYIYKNKFNNIKIKKKMDVKKKFSLKKIFIVNFLHHIININ